MPRPASVGARDAAAAKDDSGHAAGPIPGEAEAPRRDGARRRRSTAFLAALLSLVGIFYAVAVVRMAEQSVRASVAAAAQR